MLRAFVRAVVPAVLVVGLSAVPAEATSATSATFAGVVITATPLTLATVTTEIVVTTTLCLEVAANVLKVGKPPVTPGPCAITTKGTYTGSCLLGIGVTAGTYTDSTGQIYPIFLNFFAAYPTWTPSANFIKPQTGQSGSGAGAGTWTPDLVQCAGPGTTTVPVTAEFTYALI